MHELKRTPEWQRMKQSGFLRIDEQPGAITVSSPPPLILNPQLFLGAGTALVALVSLPLALTDVGWLLIGGVAAVLALLWLFPLWRRFGTMAYKARFTPEKVEFFNLIGGSMGYMPREAMKQIALEPLRTAQAKPLFVHMFYSDTAFVTAMPQFDERRALMRNNILMSAFSQPLHLDIAPTAAPLPAIP